MKLKNLMIAGLMVVAAIGAAGAVQAEDARLFVRHEVADYGVWRKAFDAFAPTAKKSGAINGAVYRSADSCLTTDKVPSPFELNTRARFASNAAASGPSPIATLATCLPVSASVTAITFSSHTENRRR